jgi:phosphatidylglycerophosphate synthase
VKPISALIVASPVSTSVGGLTLAERAAIVAQRVGLTPVRVWGGNALSSSSHDRLRSRGVAVVELPADGGPFDALGPDEPVIVVGPDVICAGTALAKLAAEAIGSGTTTPIVARDADAPMLAFVPAGAATSLLACRTLEAVNARLASAGAVRTVDVSREFCRRVTPGMSAPRIEREYLRHLNGGASESFFTKIIRRFSVPLTSRLVRLGARPTHVTLGGLVLAVASAACLAQGSYLSGLLGGLLYYASMVFDCSDGEVARLTARDSAFGAWLETMVDYLTYFLILGALMLAIRDRPDAQAYRVAALVALAGSVVIAIVASYLRYRVSAGDPGQFDESSARALAAATPFHRFARWGRQWIKRSTLAHLIVFLAIVNQLPVLLYLWAFGATLAAVAIVIVEPLVVRRVAVTPVRVGGIDSRG